MTKPSDLKLHDCLTSLAKFTNANGNQHLDGLLLSPIDYVNFLTMPSTLENTNVYDGSFSHTMTAFDALDYPLPDDKIFRLVQIETNCR